MTRPIVTALLIISMIGLIVGVDVLVFRHHFLARLLVDVGIVLVFGACYLRFVRA